MLLLFVGSYLNVVILRFGGSEVRYVTFVLAGKEWTLKSSDNISKFYWDSRHTCVREYRMPTKH